MTNLVCSSYLLPLDGMSLTDQLNAVTRGILTISVILFMFNFKWAPIFLLLSILFIIILYYIQKSQMNKMNAEHFKLTNSVNIQRPPTIIQQPMVSDLQHLALSSSNVKWVYGMNSKQRLRNSEHLFTNEERPMDYNPELVKRNIPNINPDGVFNNPNYMSKNQRMVGCPNPKTLIAPVIAPRALDLDYWRANNTVYHSAINEDSQIDNSSSGYKIDNSCLRNVVVENFEPPLYKTLDTPTVMKSHTPYYIVPNSSSSVCEKPLYATREVLPKVSRRSCDIKEGFELDTVQRETEIPQHIPNYVNTSCGYNPEQLEMSGLPTNLAAGNCTQDPAMKRYNENLFSQTIQPGVVTNSQVNEPINSNIGISYTQQFLPKTRIVDPNNGTVKFTQRDPYIIEPVTEELPENKGEIASEYNVTDPRFSGYGTSYRSYTDDNLGQTRFYYDDIDAVRMPNYITRSNIDTLPFADRYGPLQSGCGKGNVNNSNIRQLANDAFLDNALTFRTEMQERLMRKANANMWQNRSAPKRTGGQRMMGGMNKIF